MLMKAQKILNNLKIESYDFSVRERVNREQIEFNLHGIKALRL